MSILIAGMEMPTSCGFCPFKNLTMEGDECMFGVYPTTYQSRPSDCPLVPVPPHGRLIDADALKDKEIIFNHDEWDDVFDDGLLFVMEQVDNAPTIIPAEEGET